MAELLQLRVLEQSTEIPTLPVPERELLQAHRHEGQPRRTVRADHRIAALRLNNVVEPAVTVRAFAGEAIPACPWWYRCIKSWRVRMWLETGVWVRSAPAASMAERVDAR